MDITIRLLAAYRHYLSEEYREQGAYLQHVTPGATVGEILAGLPLPPGEPFTFFLNGRHAERDQLLLANDVLTIFPAAGGG